MMQRFSLLLNVVLIASLAVVLASRRKYVQSNAPSAQLLPQAAPERLDNPHGTIPTVQPFRWSQIESPDYRVYAAPFASRHTGSLHRHGLHLAPSVPGNQ